MPVPMKLNIINRSSNPLPAYETSGAAGMDLRASLENAAVIAPMQRMLIPTGLFMELPAGFEAQVRPRSGIAYKHGITVLNSPGTIDADYRGEIQVLLINLSDQAFEIRNGERIAQLIISKHETVRWQETTELESSMRGAGGFGHTGKS